MLSPFAELLAIVVPVLEIILSLLLINPKTRTLGLYSATALMIAFTAYIFAILNLGTFVPCSCGGILEKMSWDEHLLFNIVFVVLGIIAIFCETPTVSIRIKLLRLAALFVASFSVVGILLLQAERITQYENTFIRRISSTSVTKTNQYNLHYSSYYFAGTINGRVYLGNTTAQLLLTSLDTTFKTLKANKITLPDTTLPFRSISLRVSDKKVFAYDGTVPVIFSGKIGYDLSKMKVEPKFFTLAIPDKSGNLIVRTQQRGDGESILGLIDLQNQQTTTFPKLLEKQSDGLFDTDGTLLYSAESDKIVYLYAYRNGYLVTDGKMNLLSRGNTIDTLQSLNVDVKEIPGRGEKTFAKKPLTANRTAALYRNLLFVNSGMPGKFEDTRMWKRASVIDVYDINRQRYLSSFYLNDIDGKRMRQFYVDKNFLYALTGRHLVKYRINEIITKYYATRR